MANSNVSYDEKWACFSSIPEAFITPFMTKLEYNKWRKEEYGLANYYELEERPIMTIKEAVVSTRLNRNHADTLECLIDSGLSTSDAEQILYDIESEYYCPIPDEHGSYKCPNCSREVKRNQTVCENDTCELEFIWRE